MLYKCALQLSFCTPSHLSSIVSVSRAVADARRELFLHTFSPLFFPEDEAVDPLRSCRRRGAKKGREVTNQGRWKWGGNPLSSLLSNQMQDPLLSPSFFPPSFARPPRPISLSSSQNQQRPPVVLPRPPLGRRVRGGEDGENIVQLAGKERKKCPLGGEETRLLSAFRAATKRAFITSRIVQTCEASEEDEEEDGEAKVAESYSRNARAHAGVPEEKAVPPRYSELTRAENALARGRGTSFSDDDGRRVHQPKPGQANRARSGELLRDVERGVCAIVPLSSSLARTPFPLPSRLNLEVPRVKRERARNGGR